MEEAIRMREVILNDEKHLAGWKEMLRIWCGV